MTDQENPIPSVTNWYIWNMLPLEVARGLAVTLRTLIAHNSWEVKGTFESMAEETGAECDDGAYRSRLFSIIMVNAEADLWCGFNKGRAYPVLEIMVMNTFQVNVSLSLSWGRHRRPNTWMKLDFNTFNREIATQDDQVDLLAWIIESTEEIKETNRYD